jgi:hypothetical protein
MMRRLLFLLCLCFTSIPPTLAQQNEAFALPPAEWYAVVWNPVDDTLNWVNAGGTVATIQRPRLPNETLNQSPRFSLSPDGRYMVLVADLVNGRQGIGFYDFAGGVFSQIHETQAGEVVAPFGRSVSRRNRVTLGFSGGNAWRMITFNYSDGDPIDVLTSTSPLAGAIPPSAGRSPVVLLHSYNDTLNSYAVHFHLTTDGASAPDFAYVWYPDSQSLEPSDFIDLNADFQYAADEPIFTLVNRTFQTPNVAGVTGGNTIGRGEALNPQTVYGDGETVKSMPRWLAGGNWIGYYTQSPDRANWQIIPVQYGDAIPQITLSSAVRDVVGTPGGYLAVWANGTISFTVEFSQPDGVTVFTPQVTNTEQLPQVIGVTPESVPPALEIVRLTDGHVATTAAHIPPCEGVPTPRLMIGDAAQVIGDVPLRVRSSPGGTQVGEMSPNTVGQVIGGASCANGYLWWAVRWTLADGRVQEGWSAEGDAEGYFIEPLNPQESG